MPLWRGMLIIGEGYGCVGAVGMWEVSVCSVQFYCEPKTAPKTKVFVKGNVDIYKHLMKRHVHANDNTKNSVTQKLCIKTARLPIPVLQHCTLSPGPSSWFPYLSKRWHLSPRLLGGQNEFNHVKCLEKCLSVSKYAINVSYYYWY